MTTRRSCRATNEGGSAAVEMVILAPALIALMLLVVGMGRLSHGRQQVETAAAQAARAASLDRNAASASKVAQAAADETLTSRGVTCTPSPVPIVVDTSEDRPGGVVSVRVSCTVKLSDLLVAGFPGSHTWTAIAASPIDVFEQAGP